MYYSTRLALFIHGITSAKRMHEVQPAVRIGESSTQLLLDTGIRYLPIFKFQKGSIDALNFLIIPHRLHRKVNCYWGCNEKLTTSLIPHEKYHTTMPTSDTSTNCACSILNNSGARGLSWLTQIWLPPVILLDWYKLAKEIKLRESPLFYHR